MAKVTAPFLSLGASGSIAGTLTASVWKGIKTMRQKSNPANPQTAGQVAQRGFMADMVNFWRVFIALALDRTAWNLAASISGKPQSGFNRSTSLGIAAMKNLSTASMLQEILTVDTNSDSFEITATARLPSTGHTGDLTGVPGNVKWGIAPDQLLNEAALDNNVGGAIDMAAPLNTGLDAGDKFFYQIWLTQGAVYAPISGVYEIVLT